MDKEYLKSRVEENGGTSRENLQRIANLARRIAPDFSVAYLSRLLLGQPLRPIDYQALAIALGIPPAEFIEDPEPSRVETHRKATQILERIGRLDLKDRFLDYIDKAASFRNKSLDYTDLYKLLNKFMGELEDEENPEQ